MTLSEIKPRKPTKLSKPKKAKKPLKPMVIINTKTDKADSD